MDGQGGDNLQEYIESNENKIVPLPADDETESNAEAENESEPPLEEASGNLNENVDSALESGASSDKIPKVFSQDTIKSEDSEVTSSGFETDRTDKPEAKGHELKGSNKGVLPKASKSMFEIPTTNKELESGKSKISVSSSLSRIKDSNLNISSERIGQSESSSISISADKDSKAEESSYSESKCKPDLNKSLLPAHPTQSDVQILQPSSNTADVPTHRNRQTDAIEMDQFFVDDILMLDAGGNAGGNPGGNLDNLDDPEDQNPPDDHIEIPLPDPDDENYYNLDQSPTGSTTNSRFRSVSHRKLRVVIFIIGLGLFIVVLYYLIRLLEYIFGINILGLGNDNDKNHQFGSSNGMNAPQQD